MSKNKEKTSVLERNDGVRAKMEVVDAETRVPGPTIHELRQRFETPEPLGLKVQNEALVRGGNVHDVARQIAIEEADLSALPAAVAKARKALDEHDEHRKELVADLRTKDSEAERIKAVTREVTEMKTKLADYEARLAGYRANCESYERDVLNLDHYENLQGAGWLPWRANDALVAREAIKPLEKFIQKFRHELANLEAEAEGLRAEYDFNAK
jgi:hypothetical protein